TGASVAGIAYVYDVAGATPARPILTLTNPSPTPADAFGWSVAMSGTRLVVGARGDDAGDTDAGSAYVYDLAGATPATPLVTLTNPTPGFSDHFGYSVAISGTRIVVGAPEADAGVMDAGRAHVFDLASATPTLPVLTITNPFPGAFDYFGQSVAISGTRIVAGAPGKKLGTNDSAGRAYVYDLAAGSPGLPLLTLSNRAPAQYDNFG